MASITGLHLQYRLWIAEMNADINVLRIFDDYLVENATRDNNADTIKHINSYKAQFISLRKEMDELRHEMHLNKMKLAALAKTNDASVKNIEADIEHKKLEKRFNTFRNTFDSTKQTFQQFENRE